jgi:hypothetical protein
VTRELRVPSRLAPGDGAITISRAATPRRIPSFTLVAEMNPWPVRLNSTWNRCRRGGTS